MASRMSAVKQFLEKDTVRKIDTSEFMSFWKACSEEERQEFGVSAAKQLGLELTVA